MRRFLAEHHVHQRLAQLPAKFTRRSDPIPVSWADAVRRNPDKALIIAASEGNLAMVRAALQNGANVQAPEHVDGGFEHTDGPLIGAVDGGHIEVVRALLAAGANANGAELPGNPLSHAARHNQTEMVHALLAAGANPNAGEDNFALVHAVRKGNIEMIKLLLEAGANPNVERGAALQYVIEYQPKGYTQIVYLLGSAGADIHVEDEIFLSDAIRSSDVELVRALLDAGANPNPIDNDLLWSVVQSYDDETVAESSMIMALLIAAGANAQADDSAALRKILHDYFIREEVYEQVSMLLEGGADVHVEHELPLMVAIESDHVDMAKMCLARGADINVIVAMHPDVIDDAFERGGDMAHFLSGLGLGPEHG